MTDKHWNDLLEVINGKVVTPLPVAFIIDSPWIPNWYGINILDYYSNDELWFKANAKAIETFPDIMFLPGFWSEVGMCSEPSAFGARCSFPVNEFPHAHKAVLSVEDIDRLAKPNPETDGFAPFLLNRLLLNQKRIENLGHKIRFSVSRGPLNIASYLMGTTEFLTNMMMFPEQTHKLLRIITDYLVEWHELQRNTFSSIDGLLILDDILGFVGDGEFKEFALPYLKTLYDNNMSVKFLHNDADCSVTLNYLNDIGVNLFNMGFNTSINEMKKITNNKVVMLGNIPPRDVLAKGDEKEIRKTVSSLVEGLDNRDMVLYSCGGGMPPAVSTESIKIFQSELHKF